MFIIYVLFILEIIINYNDSCAFSYVPTKLYAFLMFTIYYVYFKYVFSLST